MKTGKIPQKSLFTRIWFIPFITLLVSLIALTWGNYRFADSNPGGNDFVPYWVGTRMFVLNGWSPYSEQTAEVIQGIVYGRPAIEGEDRHDFIYPLFTSLIYFTFSLIPNYTIARAFWMTFLEVIVMGLAILSMRHAKWKSAFWITPIYFIFSLFWYHGLRPIINGDAVIIVSFLLVGAFAAIQYLRDGIAGVMLAFATIKPHLALLPILLVLLWAISKRRWTLIIWTLGGMLILVLIGMIFIPDWILQNIWVVLRCPDYITELTIGAVFERWWPGIGTQLKWGLTLFLVVLIIYEWSRTWGKGYNQFLWTACLTLAVSQWIGIATDSGNFILLFFPMVLIFSVIKERWNRYGNWIVLGIMILLFVGLWWLFLSTAIYGGQPLQHLVMFIPMPLFVLIGLYWVRWWVIRPTRGISITALLTFR